MSCIVWDPKLGLAAIFALLGGGAVRAQTAADILAGVEATYGNLSSCRFEGTVSAETRIRSTASRQETRFVIAMAKPNKIKVVFDYGTGGQWVRVSDGTTLTDYRSSTSQQDRKPASPQDLYLLGSTVVSTYQHITVGLKSAGLVGSETVPIGGANVDCYVVEAQYEPSTLLPGSKPLPTRYWIDKTRFLVLRETSGSQSVSGDNETENTSTTSFSVAEVNATVPESVFAFEKHEK